MKRKERESIPVDVAARVLFRADRTCCVCRTRGKPVQIHHLDEDPSHNKESNLAVLCFDCHTDTQVRGGFHRKLDRDQVLLYRDDWSQIVAQRRATNDVQALAGATASLTELKSLTTILDVLKEREDFFQLVVHYEALGNIELRDKYIELALEQDNSDENVIFLRSLQQKQNLIPKEVIDREVQTRRKHSDWLQLGRLYSHLGDHKESARNYCKGIVRSLEKDNVFTAAYYLKELIESGLVEGLFADAYRGFTEKGDLWWRIRSLEELGWQDELNSVLKSNRLEIERSGNQALLIQLYRATGESEKLNDAQRRLAEAGG